jgi:hypothetical protein
MDRQDYYQQKAQELLAIAQATTHDPSAASWLRALANGYERLAKNAAQPKEESETAPATGA